MVSRVVTAVSAHSFAGIFGIRDRRTYPEDVHPHVGKVVVVDPVDDPLKVAALPVSLFVDVWKGRVVAFVAVAEAVGHKLIHEGVLPFKRGFLDPDRHRENFRSESVGIEDPEKPCEFAVIFSIIIY